MALVQDPTTKCLVAFSIAAFAMAFGNHVLGLFWPHWLAEGVSFSVCWAVALYVLKPQLQRFNTTWQVVSLAALGGGTLALLTYILDIKA